MSITKARALKSEARWASSPRDSLQLSIQLTTFLLDIRLRIHLPMFHLLSLPWELVDASPVCPGSLRSQSPRQLSPLDLHPISELGSTHQGTDPTTKNPRPAYQRLVITALHQRSLSTARCHPRLEGTLRQAHGRDANTLRLNRDRCRLFTISRSQAPRPEMQSSSFTTKATHTPADYNAMIRLRPGVCKSRFIVFRDPTLVHRPSEMYIILRKPSD